MSFTVIVVRLKVNKTKGMLIKADDKQFCEVQFFFNIWLFGRLVRSWLSPSFPLFSLSCACVHIKDRFAPQLMCYLCVIINAPPLFSSSPLPASLLQPQFTGTKRSKLGCIYSRLLPSGIILLQDLAALLSTFCVMAKVVSNSNALCPSLSLIHI